MVIIRKKKLLLYLAGVLIVAQVAADIGQGPRPKNRGTTVLSVTSPQLRKRIVAFKQGGVERKINTDNYNKEGVIGYAESLLGTPHAMGGYSTSGLDCSGLVKLVHAKFGVDVPRSSHDQARYGKIISAVENLKRGDLVFFHATYKKRQLITHSGIYLGENKFIHTSTSRGVSVSTLLDSGYWQEHYLFATRLAE